MAKAVLDAALSAAYQKRERSWLAYEAMDREFWFLAARACRSARDEKGLTQRDVASSIGANAPTVCYLEAAQKSGCGIDKAEKILRVLGVRFR